MSTTLDRVMDIVAAQSGTQRDRLTASSAIDQDVGISGGDVEDLSRGAGRRVW